MGNMLAHSLDTGTTREDRLVWAATRIGRKVDSFSALTIDEGITLIDGLQRAMGVKLPSKQPRRRPTRRDAEKAATEGRHDQIHHEITLVADKDVRRIQRELTRLGWDQARLDAFLASPRSPNARRTDIRTLGDANRVYWALKHITPRQAMPHELKSSEEVNA